MIKDKTISAIIKKIQSSEDILIPVSGRLDADGVGSALALVLKLKEMGKTVTCISDSIFVYPYDQFPGAQFVQTVDIPTYQPEKQDLIIVTDSGSPEKLLRDSRPEEPVTWLKPFFVINIDHHPNTYFGSINLVKTTKEANSTTRILLDIMEPLGISSEIATLLYAGLAGDSLFFQTVETSSNTFQTAARLSDLGADKVLAHMWGLRETQFTLTLREPKPGFTKGSLRGNKVPIDLTLIAKEFSGGGGHPHAASFKINEPLSKASRLVHQKIKELYPNFLLQG